MRTPRILVVYKKSAYEAYFNEYRHPRLHHAYRSGDDNLAHFKHSHGVHNQTLKLVRRELAARGLPYVWRSREAFGSAAKPRGTFDWVITVGGDGTLLEAAHGTRGATVVFGVNSDPNHSVGRFCAADARTFVKMLDALRTGRAPLVRAHRLRLKRDGKPLDGLVLNDVLVSHANPAAMSHYILDVGRSREQQRSSGVWIATAAGSTGAVRSAGAKVLPIESARYLYVPRELYGASRYVYRLKGGVLPRGKRLKLKSLMHDGRIYVDGAHRSHAFRYGSLLEIEDAREPLSLVRPQH